MQQAGGKIINKLNRLILSWLKLEKSTLLDVRNSLSTDHSNLALLCVLDIKLEDEMLLSRLLTEPRWQGTCFVCQDLGDLLLATAAAHHTCAKWMCKTGWWEWVGLAPPHVQKCLTQVNLYWLFSLAWIYQRAERARPRGLISKEIKSAGQNGVNHCFHEQEMHFSPCFNLCEVLSFSYWP